MKRQSWISQASKSDFKASSNYQKKQQFEKPMHRLSSDRGLTSVLIWLNDFQEEGEEDEVDTWAA